MDLTQLKYFQAAARTGNITGLQQSCTFHSRT